MMPVETAWCYIVLHFSEGSCNTVSCIVAVFSFISREQEKIEFLKQYSQSVFHITQFKDLELYE